MRQIARYHLYLGCLFAPLIMFFAVSGTWQALNLHRSLKDGSYRAPPVLVRLSDVHIRREWRPAAASEVPPRERNNNPTGILPRTAFAWAAALAAAGLAATSGLGIALAFMRTAAARRRTALFSLTAGCLLPVVLLAV